MKNVNTSVLFKGYGLNVNDNQVKIPGENQQRTILMTPAGEASVRNVLMMHSPETVIFLFPHVSRNLGEWMRERNYFYMDYAGNAWIEGESYYLRVEGLPKIPIARDEETKTSRAFTATGLRVLFIILVNSDLLNAPIRTIADASGTSVGAVANALRDLERDGYLIVNGRKRLLTKQPKLIQRWVELYASILKPKLKTRTCEGAEPQEIVANPELWEKFAQLGGEAAMLSKGFGIRPVETRFYSEYPWQDVARFLKLRPAEDGNVVLTERFWNPHYLPASPLVPSLLVFADEFTDGDERQAMIAQEMWNHDEDLQQFQ
jgi:hypothetical protein